MMSKIWFTADPHFGDDRIRKYENRPFATVDEMDEQLIARWNRVVAEDDTVYVLGDFGATGREAEIVSRLNGRTYLVKGNHDTLTNEAYRAAGFCEVYDLPVILDGFWILSHDALYVNTNMPYANLFGHMHNSPVVRDYSPQHMCVSVERTDYTPVSFDTVKALVAKAVQENR